MCPLVAGESLFQVEDIFPPGDKHAHSSSLVETRDGRLLACWFYGSGERRADDVVVQGASLARGSRAWSPVTVLADTPGFPDCNPVLFVDERERVWLFWIVVLANRWECSQLTYRRAEGLNTAGVPEWDWQGVINLKPGSEFVQSLEKGFQVLGVRSGMWAEYARPYHRLLLEAAEDPFKRQTGWMTRTHPTVLPSGRWLLPVYSDGFNASLMAISDDAGETWRASGPIVGLGPIQPSVVRRRDGRLVAYCRDSGDVPNRVLVSESDDDGETWSPATDSTIPNPGSSLEVLALKDGRWLWVGNDTEQGRHRLSVMVSGDEGKNWSAPRVLEPREDGGRGFDYPSVMQSRDGRIHVTYSASTDGGRCIRHAAFDPEWLEAPEAGNSR